MQLRRLGFVRGHGHGQETRGAAPAQVPSVSSCLLLQPNRQRFGRFDLLVEDDGPVRVVAGLFNSVSTGPNGVGDKHSVVRVGRYSQREETMQDL
jgi:hypothetical protein